MYLLMSTINLRIYIKFILDNTVYRYYGLKISSLEFIITNNMEKNR